ncbi:hypothetical protein ACE1ET_01160 [Saccharicrinis sp. FJH62]|uniref:hypothetical protein n=1 Tax=Saccharicrinis sp. FJH62 TaxID=3344657 RepID=UPI0035D464A6
MNDFRASMIKVGKYKILPEAKLIIEYYSGKIDMDDIIHMQKVLSENSLFDSTFNRALDFRDATLMIDTDDFKRYLEFLKGFPKIFGKRNAAYLTNTPNDVVVTTLFDLIVQQSDVPINIGIYSTLKGILKWFNITDMDSNTLESIINDLKTQPNNVFSE